MRNRKELKKQSVSKRFNKRFLPLDGCCCNLERVGLLLRLSRSKPHKLCVISREKNLQVLVLDELRVFQCLDATRITAGSEH